MDAELMLASADELLDRAACLVDPEGDDFYRLTSLSNALSLLAIADSLNGGPEARAIQAERQKRSERAKSDLEECYE